MIVVCSVKQTKKITVSLSFSFLSFLRPLEIPPSKVSDQIDKQVSLTQSD